MKTRVLTEKQLGAELSRAEGGGAFVLRESAAELLDLLKTEQVPAQAVADAWIAEQTRWNRRIVVLGPLAIKIPARRPRAIRVQDGDGA